MILDLVPFDGLPEALRVHVSPKTLGRMSAAGRFVPATRLSPHGGLLWSLSAAESWLTDRLRDLRLEVSA